MKRNYKLVAIARLAIAGLAICSIQLMAQDPASVGGGQVAAAAFSLPAGNAASSASMLMGILSIAPTPPTAGAWPCVGASADCPSAPAGSLVIGFPSIVGVPHSCSSCAQIYFTFDTTTATGSASITIDVKQGLFTIAKGTGTITLGTPPQAIIGTLSGFTFTSRAVPGDATINVSVVNNGVTIRNSAPIVLN